MPAPLRIVHDSDHDLWLEKRREGLGGSDAPAILGLSTFAGPAKVAAQKLGFEIDTKDDDELLEWGHDIEPIMIKRLKRETGVEAVLDGWLYQSTTPGYEFMQATLDGRFTFEGVDGTVESKFVRYTTDRWDEGTPESVICQVQHGLFVMDLPVTYVLAALDGYKFRWARIERDQKYIDEVLLPTMKVFWLKLCDGESIAPAGAPDREYEALKARYPMAYPGKKIDLIGDEFVSTYDQWKVMGKEKSAAEKKQKEARNVLIAAMEDAEFGVLDNGEVVSLKEQTRKEYVVKESTFRVLRTSK